MYYIKSEASFDAAHFLKGYEGKCGNIHGHRWRVVVYVRGEKLKDVLNEKGMIMDFTDFKIKLKEISERFDHKLIYEDGSLKDSTIRCLEEEGFALVNVPFRTTAENFSKYIYKELKKDSPEIDRVEVYETPSNCAAYEE